MSADKPPENYTLDELEAIEFEVVGVAKQELDLFLKQATPERLEEATSDVMLTREQMALKKSIAASFHMGKAIMDYVADKRRQGPHSNMPLPDGEIQAAMRRVGEARANLRLVK